MQHVGRLPVDQREVLLLAVVEELRYEEIAAVLRYPGRHRDVATVPRAREAARGLRRGRRLRLFAKIVK